MPVTVHHVLNTAAALGREVGAVGADWPGVSQEENRGVQVERSRGKPVATKTVKSKAARGGGLWDVIKTVFYAVLIALVVRTFAYEPFNIPSRSMLPGLLVGDYLFVSKFSYGYSNHSFPWSPSLFKGRVLEGTPTRGDVIVFKVVRPSGNFPVRCTPALLEKGVCELTDYIKRVIGLPGDKIQVKEGRLFINGKIVRREKVTLTDTGSAREVKVGDKVVTDAFSGYSRELLAKQALIALRRGRILYIEMLPGGRTHTLLEQSDSTPADNTDVYTVPKGRYFMMGDNRDNSQDSRFPTVGYVPADRLVGRADFLFASTSGSLIEFWKWRWGRIFLSVR